MHTGSHMVNGKEHRHFLKDPFHASRGGRVVVVLAAALMVALLMAVQASKLGVLVDDAKELGVQLEQSYLERNKVVFQHLDIPSPADTSIKYESSVAQR